MAPQISRSTVLTHQVQKATRGGLLGFLADFMIIVSYPIFCAGIRQMPMRDLDDAPVLAMAVVSQPERYVAAAVCG
ncbi:MAG: hypothetical protein R8G34_08595 [Paracoccaceae bacterium]|nr:hypothetical protein [Paracoccaceae bacterium]